MTAEQARLDEACGQQSPWKKWGPYLSERQWGSVREDCSEGGNAWGGEDLQGRCLFLDMHPWQACAFSLSKKE
jgi:hypothetical protein